MTYHCTADLLFILFGLGLNWINYSFTCLFKSKPVKHEVSCTVILPPMVSILWLLHRPWSFTMTVFFSEPVKPVMTKPVKTGTNSVNRASRGRPKKSPKIVVKVGQKKASESNQVPEVKWVQILFIYSLAL